MLFQNENRRQQYEQLFMFIIFTVAFFNMFLSRSHSDARDEWFLYELQYNKKKKKKEQQQSRRTVVANKY